MSDPVTNAEVEDVLSSIRRLVSEEKRPMPAAQAKEGADRLVLTPALRVEEEGDADVAPASAEGFQSARSAPAERVQQDTVGETAKQLFDPSDDMPSDVYSRQVDPSFGWSDEDEALFDDLVPEETGHQVSTSSDVTQTEEVSEEDLEDDYSNDPYDFSDDMGDADVSASVVESDGEQRNDEGMISVEVEEDTLSADDNDMFDFDMLKNQSREAAPVENATADTNDTSTTQAHADAPDEDRQAGMVAASKAATLSAKIAALETAIGNIADTWEPDTPGTDDYSGTDQPAMAWEDDVSHDATGVPLRSEAAQAAWQEAHPDVVMIGTARAAAAAAAAFEERAAEHKTQEEQRNTRAQDQADEDQAAKERGIAAARAAAAERVAADKRAAEERLAALTQAAEARAAQHEAPQDLAPIVAADDAAPAKPVAEPETAGLEYSDDSQLLDEEALRDLVSEIVRAELQGALGERITRNVRKLVRREIHRALTAQELE